MAANAPVSCPARRLSGRPKTDPAASASWPSFLSGSSLDDSRLGGESQSLASSCPLKRASARRVTWEPLCEVGRVPSQHAVNECVAEVLHALDLRELLSKNTLAVASRLGDYPLFPQSKKTREFGAPHRLRHFWLFARRGFKGLYGLEEDLVLHGAPMSHHFPDQIDLPIGEFITPDYIYLRRPCAVVLYRLQLPSDRPVQC